MNKILFKSIVIRTLKSKIIIKQHRTISILKLKVKVIWINICNTINILFYFHYNWLMAMSMKNKYKLCISKQEGLTHISKKKTRTVILPFFIIIWRLWTKMFFSITHIYFRIVIKIKFIFFCSSLLLHI